ncbi:MAG: Sensor histidine kinase [Myxococcales bacterium]|nr:Sensor histidine kinase [Myxococcales bacterium]
MKQLRDVLRRLPSLFDRGAFDAACHDIRRVVPIDQLGIARVSNDGTHFRAYVTWTSPDVGIPAVKWAQRLEVTRADMAALYPGGAPRICRDTLVSPEASERAHGEAGICCTVSLPIGDPLVGVVALGLSSAELLSDQHVPLLREVAAMLIDRLDESLVAANAGRLQKVMQAMPMGAIMVAADGTVDETNPAAERLLGRSATALVGVSLRDLITAPDGGRLGWRLDQPAGPAAAILHTRAGPRPVVVQLAAPATVAGQPFVYGPLFIVDNSAERAAAAALERRTDELHRLEAEHRAVIDDLPVIVFTHDHLGRATYVSRAIERILGYTPEECYAMPNFGALNVDPVPPDYGTRPGVYERDFRQRRRDGREIVMRYTVRVLGDDEGRVTGAEGFGVDVTSERDAQHRLLLADRLTALGMLVAGVGHEINNPAAYVALGVQQIARHLRGARMGSERAEEAIERVLPILDDVSAGVHRIAEIVGELKLFSRHPGADAPGPIDLNGVVRSAASLVQAELRSRARLVVELGELPPLPGAWARLSQVVLNLLINAAQAIPPGAPEANEVSVSTLRAGSDICIVVRDSGCGISPDAQQRIFDPFYTTKPVGEGTGLGLAISYDIVRRLGGVISLESDAGRGSRFTVSVPYVAPPPAVVERPSLMAVASGSVLVVDDERALGSAIARELSGRMQVRVVHTGKEAIAELERSQYDAVLCDLRMPGVSGADVYRRTQARDSGQADRFVFLTGAGGLAAEADFLRTTGRPVLEKPFAMADLWRTVGAVVRARPS